MGTTYRDIDSFSGSDFEAKLRNAIDQCRNIPGGDSMVLMIPEGNYTVSQCIEVNNSGGDIAPFTIKGQPSGFSNNNRICAPDGFLKIVNNNNDATFITLENISICGISDPGQYPDLKSQATCIECDGKWIKLKGLCISQYACGIKMSDAYNLIENVAIYKCTCGIEVTPVGVTIQNCHITTCSAYGIKTLPRPLPLPSGSPSNALNIIGLIAESNGTHIEINQTDYVSITNSYIGDCSTTAIKNNGGTHVQIDNMLQSIGGPHRIIHQASGSMKCSGYYYCPDKTISGIKIDGGEIDFSDMKVYLAYSFIENTNGKVIMPESRFQNGYELSGTGDDSTMPTSFNGTLIPSGTNFVGLPQYELWSKYNNSPLNIYIPGVCYNFSFPTYMQNKIIYLHIGLNDVPNDVSVDIFFNGGEVAQPVTAFLAAAINVVNDNYHRIRLKAGYKYLNIPISLSSSSFQATIAAPLLQNQTRNKVVTISYIFANYDNRFNIPVEWEEV